MQKEFTEGQISIVIPVYNAAPYIEDALTSIKEQTYSNWEVILVEDQSTDDSLQVLENWIQKNGTDKYRLLKNEKNSGPAYSRNQGIRAARGQYLSYLDADDVWDKTKLEKQLNFMKEKQCAFSFTGYEFADENAVRNGKVVHVPKQIVYEEALKNTTISTITVMFDRRQIPTDVLLMPEDCQREDTATWWKILKSGYTAYGLDEPLSVYRRHAGSHSANKVKAVIGTYRMYRKQEQMGFFKTMGYMMNYIYGAVKRRL